MSELRPEAATQRLKRLSDRTEAAADKVRRRTGKEGRPNRWLAEVRDYLKSASDEGLIQESFNQIYSTLLLKLDPTPRPAHPTATFHTIQVGQVNFKNRPGTPRFTRADGAWFDFGLILRQLDSEVDLFSYRFALRLPGFGPWGLVRFDLNPPDHDNDRLGLRAHAHLFTDDETFSIPSPFMTPVEVLDVILFRLQPELGKGRGGSGPRRQLILSKQGRKLLRRAPN